MKIKNNHIPTVSPLNNGVNVILHLIALLWTDQRAITLFCTDTGAKSVIARSLVTNYCSVQNFTNNNKFFLILGRILKAVFLISFLRVLYLG